PSSLIGAWSDRSAGTPTSCGSVTLIQWVTPSASSDAQSAALVTDPPTTIRVFGICQRGICPPPNSGASVETWISPPGSSQNGIGGSFSTNENAAGSTPFRVTLTSFGRNCATNVGCV